MIILQYLVLGSGRPYVRQCLLTSAEAKNKMLKNDTDPIMHFGVRAVLNPQPVVPLGFLKLCCCVVARYWKKPSSYLLIHGVHMFINKL